MARWISGPPRWLQAVYASAPRVVPGQGHRWDGCDCGLEHELTDHSPMTVTFLQLDLSDQVPERAQRTYVNFSVYIDEPEWQGPGMFVIDEPLEITAPTEVTQNDLRALKAYRVDYQAEHDWKQILGQPSIYRDRYGGTYSGGAWVACIERYETDTTLRDTDAFGGDVETDRWWSESRESLYVAVGFTPSEAWTNLRDKWIGDGQPTEFYWEVEIDG